MLQEKLIAAGTQQKWRAWLEKNHLEEKKVGIVVHKKHTGKPSLSHREYMEEAICFGWIDTIIKRLDADRFIRYFCRRNDKSKWSKNTLSYAKRLLTEGRIAPEGIRRYKEGLSRRTHDHDIPDNPQMPRDLKQTLGKANAAEQFSALPPSSKRMYLRWLFHAKLPETRTKRIAAIVKAAQNNQKRLL